MKDMHMSGMMINLCHSGPDSSSTFEDLSRLVLGVICAFSNARKESWCFRWPRRCGEDVRDGIDGLAEVAEAISVAIDPAFAVNHESATIEGTNCSRRLLKYVICPEALRAAVTTF
jgi:hypothetical protein